MRTLVPVRDVAAFILRDLRSTDTMKLQKLCYFSYGYHLVWESRRLFPEHFEAWANGPVVPELFRMHRGRFLVNDGDLPGNPDALDDGELESVRIVLAAYRDVDARTLSAATHQPGPWTKARERAGAGPLDRATERLLDGEIAEYFETLTATED